jgi:hypothetical protein
MIIANNIYAGKLGRLEATKLKRSTDSSFWPPGFQASKLMAIS